MPSEVQSKVDPWAGWEAEQERQAEEIRRLYYKQSIDDIKLTVGERYKGGLLSLLTEFPHLQKTVSDVRDWLKGFWSKAQGLYIYGNFGTGKTGIARGIQMALLEKRVDVLFWSVPDLLSAIKDSFDRPEARSEREIIEACAGADCLILDDLGAEGGGAWGIRTMELILDKRYQDNRPVVITSNHSRDALAKLAGNDHNAHRILRRLGEMTADLNMAARPVVRASQEPVAAQDDLPF